MTGAKQDSTNGRVEDERRHSTRYMIRGDAWFQWQAADGTWCEGHGLTRDIGRAGTFIKTSTIPPVASRVKVVVTLLAKLNENVNVRLWGSGEVRHVRRGGHLGSGYGAWALFHTEAPVEEE